MRAVTKVATNPSRCLVGLSEKLWINQKVNEPAPFASTLGPKPLYTGRLEGKAHPASGRTTIYKSRDGKQYLRLTDLTTSNGPDVHVVLARSGDASTSYSAWRSWNFSNYPIRLQRCTCLVARLLVPIHRAITD